MQYFRVKLKVIGEDSEFRIKWFLVLALLNKSIAFKAKCLFKSSRCNAFFIGIIGEKILEKNIFVINLIGNKIYN